MHEQELEGYEAELARSIQRVMVEQVMRLAMSAPMPQVRAIATSRLQQMVHHIHSALEGHDADGMTPLDADQAHLALLGADIARLLHRPAEAYSSPSTPAAPPGAPIGQAAENWVAPPVALNVALPSLGSLLDLLLPPETACGWES